MVVLYVALIGIPIAVVAYLMQSNRKLIAQYRQLTEHLGLELELRRHFLFQIPRGSGAIKGRKVEIDTVERSQGKKSRRHAYIRVECENPQVRVLLIYPKILKLMRFKFQVDKSVKLKQFPTGDDNFDNQFIVKTSSEAFALKLLSPPMRHSLASSNCLGGVSYTVRGLVYEQPGDLETELARQRIEEMTPILVSLAEKISG